MADEKRERAFRRWVNTVEGLSATCDDFEELHDGVLLSEILGQAAPSDIATEDVDDLPSTDEAKAKNIRTIISGLVSFYSDTFGSTETFEHIDADAIATRADGMHKSLNLLLELVIGCVINCSDKALYIEAIQQMDPESQTQIMHVIQGIMSKYADGLHNETLEESFAGGAGASSFSTPLTAPRGRGSRPDNSAGGGAEARRSSGDGEEVGRLQALVNTLQQQLDAKTEDTQALAAEVQTLRQEMQDAAKREKAKELEKMKIIKTAMSQREVEISGGLRDLESQCAQLEQANALLQRQLKQKDSAWKEKMQAQADELAAARTAANRADQLEAKLKRRNAELRDLTQLRDHVQEVEAQNLDLEDRNGTLLAETSKIPTLNKQLQTYRDKLTAAEIAAADYKLSTATRLEDAEDKVRDLERKLAAQQQLNGSGASQNEPQSPAINSSWSSGQQAEMHGLRKKNVRLNNENARLSAEIEELRATVDAAGAGVGADKQHLLQHHEKKRAELLQENRKLARELAALKEKSTSTSGADGGGDTLATPGKRSSAGEAAAAAAQEAILTYKKQLTGKQKELEKLTTEKQKMEEYAKKLMGRMKQQTDRHAVATHSLQDHIDQLKASASAMQLAHKREQQLFQAAFYSIGREMAPGLLQEASANRLRRTPGGTVGTTAAGGGGSSWLSRKRNEMKR